MTIKDNNLDDKFSIWDLKNARPEDTEIMAAHGMNTHKSGAGATDPKAIDFLWHQRNFENALNALKHSKKPEVDGQEGRRSVELITAIYKSIKQGGTRVSI